ncbi:phosphoglycerate kinase [Caldisphaera sp.]|uniref:phosphoglycerate kinase n=1 Tax=Caldisphaera sp. TaxID=2060322 RepID=UPI00397B6EE0
MSGVAISYNGKNIATLDDVDLTNKKVLARIDINSPIKNNEIMDTSRIRSHVKTIKELVELGSKLVIMSHQGRPGESDFISLRKHSEILSKMLGFNVEFISDITGPEARKRIATLEVGEVLVLENTRFLSEENIEMPFEQLIETNFVRKLSPLFNYYIGDAFASSHRSQASIAGFPLVIPGVAGRVMEDEIKGLSKALHGERPRTFFIGGAKLNDAIKIIDHIVKSNKADYILTGGLVSLLILKAKGFNIGNAEKIINEKFGHLIPEAKALLNYENIIVPDDFVSEINNEIEIVNAKGIKGSAKDIGPETISKYSDILKNSKTIVMRGPAGVIEDERFKIGTIKIAEASLNSNAYVIFGGGHFISILDDLSPFLRKKIGYISTGGGAVVYFLSGERMPGIEALTISYEKFFKGI